MQSARPPARAPGSFSPLPGTSSSTAELLRPSLSRMESSSSDDSTAPLALVNNARGRALSGGGNQQPGGSATPIYASFTAHPNGSTNSLQNFSRPTLSAAQTAAARSVASAHSSNDTPRNAPSPLTLPPATTISPTAPSFSGGFRGHARKHSANAGMFDSTLPSTSVSNLPHIGMVQASPKLVPAPQRELSASHIAAQAAVMQHQNQQQMQMQHSRQRSQTVPVSGGEYEVSTWSTKRGSGGPLSPPLLSLTEASAPKDSGFGNQSYRNGLLGSHASAATTAANIAFPRSTQPSPNLSKQGQPTPPPPPNPPPLPPIITEKPKPEKSKVKLFSRPGKVGTRGEAKEKPLPSPSKIGQALSNLQRGNFSTTSLDSTAQSFYSLGNSSSATIRAVEFPVVEKEKKHHFLSRQKHKLKDKEDFHLPLSSASSNSRPTDPHAPSSLYNFNLPLSPSANASTFKSMSGLDLRHGGRALREKKKDDKSTFDDAASSYTAGGDWLGPGTAGSATTMTPSSSLYLHEPIDGGKYGLNGMAADDAWPYLRAKLLVIFEGEDLRLPVEDFNRIVTLHIQFCIARRAPTIIVEDLRDLLATGFASLDYTLRMTPEDRLIPALVELWIFTFTSILPYMQAVMLPLDLEFAGHGSLLTAEQAREFWGGVVSTPSTAASTGDANPFFNSQPGSVNVTPASAVLDVRRIVLVAYRDMVILPRYETLKNIFSRLSLEFLPQSLASLALASPGPAPSPGFQSMMAMAQQYPLQPPPPLSTSPSADSTSSFGLRPGTAMSLDPSTASYNSTGTTLLGDAGGGGGGGGSAPGSGSRSRAISNVSYGSEGRPFTPSGGLHVPAHAPGSGSGGSAREQNVEDSKQVTEMVGRMLQCMSVLASVGVGSGGEGNMMVEELNKLLKLNWLGRGRTGRNRRGMVGGRVRRGTAEVLREVAGEGRA